jgi:hypothetical protein
MKKTARKRSADPIQEALRQKKENWNADVSLLIAKLIAFKRGINGRGDYKAGLPATKIQNPFPPEVGSYLNDVANDYIKVVHHAKDIIDSQSQYSVSRQKGVKSSQLEIEQMVSEASWWGSRWWAKWGPGLKGVPKSIKDLRIKLLTFASNNKSVLRGFENDFASGDMSKLKSTMNEFVSWGHEYVNLFINTSRELLVEEKNISKQEQVDSDKKDGEQESSENVEPTKSEEPKGESPQKEEKATEKEISTDPPQGERKRAPRQTKNKTNKDIADLKNFEKIKIIESQLLKWREAVFFIKQNMPEVTNVGNIENLLGALETSVNKLMIDYRIPGKAAAIDYELFLGMLILYQMLAESVGRALFGKGITSDPDKILERIEEIKGFGAKTEQPNQPEQISEASENLEDFEKYSHNKLTRWLRRKLLGLSKDNADKIKLKISEDLKSAADMLSKIMNMLEDKEASTLDILAETYRFNGKIYMVYSNLQDLANAHYWDIEAQSKGKKKDSDKQAKRTMISNIKTLMNQIFPYTPQKDG